MTMMAMKAAPPKQPPVSPQKQPVSPRKKQKSTLSLMPTTPRTSRVAISSFNNMCIGFSNKNALFRSFSELCLDDLFDDEEEEQEQEPQKQAFMASLVNFLDDDEFFDDSKLRKMCTEWKACTDAVAGGTKEEVEFNSNLASLFGCFTDLLTNKRVFGKKECSTLQQEMERLKEMHRRMAMSNEYKPDASGFPQAPPRSPVTRSRKQSTPERQHDSVTNMLEYALKGWQRDVVLLQQERGGRGEEVFEEQKRGTGSKEDPGVTPPSRSIRIESGREPVTSGSQSPTRWSERNRRSPKSRIRRLHKSNDDDGNRGKPSQSGSMDRRNSSLERRHHRTNSAGPKSTEHSSPVRSSLKRARRTTTPLPGELSSLMLSPRHPSKHRDLVGASSYHSQSPRNIDGLATTLHMPSSRKGDSMSLLGASSHTSRSMPVSLSPRKSSKTSGQSDPFRSLSPRRTTTPLPGELSSLMLSPRHPSKHRDLLGASSYHSQSPRKIGGLAATLHMPSSRKGDSMSLLGASSHTSCSMPVSLSPRKSSKTAGQSDPCRSLSPRRTTTPLPGELSSLMLSPRHASKHRDLLGATSYRSQTPRNIGGLTATLHMPSSRKGDSMCLLGASSHTSRSMPVSLSPRKSSKTSGQSDPFRSLISPRRLRTGASSPVKNHPLGVSESIRAVLLHGTPKRFTEKSSTGRISLKSEHRPSYDHHLARLHDWSGVPDSPKTSSSRSSRKGRTRSQSQTPRTRLSRNLEMFSNCDDLVFSPSPVYSSNEKEDSAPRQPSRAVSTEGSGGRRSSKERQPIPRYRAHSVAPDVERKSRSSSRGCSIATSGASPTKRRSKSVAPETGSFRSVRSNSVTRDPKKSSDRSHLDLLSRSGNSPSKRRSKSVAPETGSFRSVRSNSVTRDPKKSSARSHLNLVSRSGNSTSRGPSLGSIVYVD